MFSGGIGSWAAAKRLVADVGPSDVTLLFTDTLIEDEDLYRFLAEGAENVGAKLIQIAERRTPWEVFRSERFLGNSRADPCSKILKRQVATRWLREHCNPDETIVYLGIDWTESHRFERARLHQQKVGWKYEAPLCSPPYIGRSEIFAWLERERIRPPRLYGMGFSHNNCGGFCCKAGHSHFANLLRVFPERYASHEAAEEELRNYLGRDVAMMVDRRGDHGRKPLTMRQLRMRLQQGGTIDRFDIGGCGCFSDDLAAKEP